MSDQPVKVTERVMVAAGRALLALPDPLKRLLSGRSVVRLDGQELAADVQLLLRLLALRGHQGLDTMMPDDARAEIVRSARLSGPGESVEAVEPLVVPGPAGPMPARLYRRRHAEEGCALLVYYHGGGWVVGGLDTHDSVCRFLAHHADVAVLAVDYRLAPEHRFPAAVEDAVAAFRWAAAHAARLGFDPRRIGVAGDSAGGNLAAVTAQLTARAGGPAPAAQLLIYPVTDLSTKHRSYGLFADGFFLTHAEMDWYRGHYLPDESAARDPRASPLLAEQLDGLAPAVVLTAGFDVLRDEGEAYARRLQSAGVPTTLHRYEGLIHGFANATSISPSSRRAMEQAAGELAQLFARCGQSADRVASAG